MILSRHQKTGRGHILLIANKSFEDIVNLKHLRMTTISQIALANKEQMKLGKFLLPIL